MFYIRTKNRKQVIMSAETTADYVRATRSTGNLPSLFYDVSALYLTNEARGIHRVVINILKKLLTNYKEEFNIVLVRSSNKGIYTCNVDNYDDTKFRFTSNDDLVKVKPGDIFISLDLYKKFNFIALHELQKKGLKVYFIVYDILDLRDSHLGENDIITKMIVRSARNSYNNWLHSVISIADGVICDSETVLNELAEWVNKNISKNYKNICLGHFHLGADFDCLNKENQPMLISFGDSTMLIEAMKKPSFLMVGVMDPHKCHLQSIRAFEELWSDSIDVSLIIVGKEGMLQPHLGTMIQAHEEYGRRLFWFSYVSDEDLVFLYKNCSALLAASFSEGFCLPLIEAAHHNLPIIARDIPIFREVAGNYAYFFKNNNATDLAEAVVSWLSMASESKIPESRGMPYLNWEASTHRLFDIVINDRWTVCYPVEDGFLLKSKKEIS
ncbi:glycosyltransferase family 4 protein [Acidithiobacillus ferrooxidans]|uniref:glycosyltransferase family 4 protein n=1 Tax=Acidithiobacillus ferrooxidans TaxID=920 RepID=UPI000AB6C491|nr:glycosyltransferase family 1 protein [Acidithiobacillus ferrooxidans]MCR2830913.1 glycosyltransferase family 4 protein [Acidithiobacillus ferrooxidans]